jgi:hypothetical protein
MIRLKQLLETSSDPCYPFTNKDAAIHFLNWMWDHQKITATNLGIQGKGSIDTCDDITDELKSAYNAEKATYVQSPSGYEEFTDAGGKTDPGSEDQLKNRKGGGEMGAGGNMFYDFMMLYEASPYVAIGALIGITGLFVLGGVGIAKLVRRFGPQLVKGSKYEAVLTAASVMKKMRKEGIEVNAIKAAKAEGKTIDVYIKDMMTVQQGKKIDFEKTIADPKRRYEIVKALENPNVLKAFEKDVLDAVILDAATNPAITYAEIMASLPEKLQGKLAATLKATKEAQSKRLSNLDKMSTGGKRPKPRQ